MISTRLRQLRQERDLTLDQLATLSGINRATIHRIELNQVSPRLETLDMLCRALGTNLQGFFQVIPADLPPATEDAVSSGPDDKEPTSVLNEERNTDTAGIRKGVLEWLEHVEALIHHSVDPLMVLDMEGTILYASPAAVRMLDGRPGERRCTSWFDRAHPNEQPLLRASLQALLDRPQEHVSVAYRVRHPDESWRWVRSNCSNQLDHPSIQGILVNTQDITQHKQLEQDLLVSGGRLRAILDAMPDMLIVLQADGTLLDYHAPRFQCAFPDMADRIGQNLRNLPFSQEQREHLQETINRAISTGEIQECVYPIEVGGKIRIRELRVHRSTPAEVLVLVRDITDQRRIEEQKQHDQKLECLGVVAGGVAHQFSNILMGVQGSLELAVQRIPEESRALHHLQVIQESLKRAAYITNQLQDFAGHPILFPELTDLNQLVKDALHTEPTIIAPEHTLHLRLQEGIPKIQMDYKAIQRVFLNLVTNACESIGPRPGTITISTGREALNTDALERGFSDHSIEQPGEFVQLSVEDTGCGLDAKTLERALDPFFTTKFAGRGLGLSAAQGLVRAHRGGIKIESRPGAGSRFTVYLPVSTQMDAEVSSLDATGTDRSKRRKILIAEDEELLRTCLCNVVSRLGYFPIESKNGVEAVEAYRTYADEIALVLLDINMPIMDGREAFHAIRKLDPNAKVVLSTGSCEDTFGNAPEAKHLAAVMRKPYSANDLRELLQRIL